MPRVFAVGYHGDGQLGETDISDDSNADSCFYRPVEIEDAPDNVEMISCGLKHTLFLTKNGGVYSVGNNECGQLGRDQYRDESFSIKKIELKSTIKIVQIASGHFHNAAVADDGRFFMWGANHCSQCGITPCAKICIPERISVLVNVVQVACGEHSTIVLTESCSVFMFGLVDDKPMFPVEVEFLSFMPIVQVAAGGSHFGALTAGGQVFTWGKNLNGEMGTEISDRYSAFPKCIKGLSKAVFLSCGLKHTAVLTQSGHVFTFGLNSHGQLGEPAQKVNKSTHPKAVPDLLGTSVTNVVCGSRNTVVVSKGMVRGFGLNKLGQLGIGSDVNTSTPTVVKHLDGVIAVFCGAEHSYFLVDDMSDPRTTPLCARDVFRIPKFLTFGKIRQLVAAQDKEGIITELESVFSSIGCMNGSFLYEDDRRYDLKSIFGLNLDDVMYAMNALEECTSSREFINLITTSLEMCGLKDLEDIMNNSRLPVNAEMFRIFFTLTWLPQMNIFNKHFIVNFMIDYARILWSNVDKFEQVFIDWWKGLPTRHFNRFTKSLMNVLEYMFPLYYNNISQLEPLLKLVKKLSEVNKMVEKIPYDHFHLNCLEEKVNVKLDYLKYYLYHHPDLKADGVDVPRGPNAFFWLNYPFLMNVIAKSNILETHSKVLQHCAIQRSYSQDIVNSFIMGLSNSYLQFNVGRNTLVEDTVTQMTANRIENEDFFKPLKVSFRGEEGEDEGGVRKEYFMLLFKELLQPTYGMFTEDEESHYIWFSGFPVENEYFTMVGCLCAMAIYNSILVELPFPLALYKFLLGVPFTIEDMRELHPTEARSLDAILDYDGDDLEDVFMLTFNIPFTIFGHTEEVDLKPDGKNIPVTSDNRAEFVDLYIKKRMEYGHDDVLKRQLQFFKSGFSKLLDGTIVSLFQPRELMELSAGNENYNWEELRENCQYKDKYFKDHPAIKAFWAAFGELSEEEKKNFLLFLMGTSRIPWKGMSKVEMVIQPTDSTKLPVAHTCFNLLDLPNIEDKDELLKRLRICIDNNQGFTLV